MLLFNKNKIFLITLKLVYFNTSNVTIQRFKKMAGYYKNQNFNTSNVTIQRLKNAWN